MKILQTIQSKIFEIRGERVILDYDLANLYEVDVRVLNQAVKRNLKRFPMDFMFQLTSSEYEIYRIQIEPTEEPKPLTSQIVTLKKGRGQHRKFLPYAFTEQGVAMLSGVLNSEKAIQMNIAIMRAFVELRQILIESNCNDHAYVLNTYNRFNYINC